MCRLLTLAIAAVALTPSIVTHASLPDRPSHGLMNRECRLPNTAFKEAFAYTVILKEGGDKLHTVKGDPGGLTRWGIAQKYHPDVNVRTMDRAGAEQFYLKKVWIPYNLHLLNSSRVAIKVFDLFVRLWFTRGTKVVQNALNELDYKVDVDGQFGPATISALNESIKRHGESVVLAALCGEAYTDLKAELRKSPGKRHMAAGLIQRVHDCPQMTLA